MNYDEMEAGREMDALVAEKIMLWKQVEMSSEAWADIHNQWHDDYMGSKDGWRTLVPYYSRDISAAWEVVEKMRASLCHWKIIGTETSVISKWTAIIYCNNSMAADAPTAPLAICRAALKAVGETK